MNINDFTASSILQKEYVKRKVNKARYSIVFSIIIYAIVGIGFYLKLDNIYLVIINLIVTAIPIGIFIYMSTYRQGLNVNTLVSSIVINDNNYQITSYSFEGTFFKLPAITITTSKNKVYIEKAEFPYNEDGLVNGKKETLCLIVDGKIFYLLYKYFPEELILNFDF